MTRQPFSLRWCAMLAALVPACALPALAQTPSPIVQPGAPGGDSRLLSAEEAWRLVGVQYNDVDVRFVQDMIAHHAQALELTALLDGRSERDDMRQLARRIELSQNDEIRTMQGWLRDRGQSETADAAARVHDGHTATGMLSAEEIARLAATRGAEFDRLFLELMIKHHRGALAMIDALFVQAGTAQDSQLFSLTSDVLSEQTAEIERMGTLLALLSPDPRAGLRAGFRDAGEAARNMALVTTLPKPDGFFDPAAPAGRPNVTPPRPTARPRPQAAAGASSAGDASQGGQAVPAAPQAAADATPEARDGENDAGPRAQTARPGLLSFANTDLAFAGKLAVAGNYHGFNVYDVGNPTAPRLLVSVVCPGGQGDVSVYGHLLFMSVEQARGRLDCGLQGVAEQVSDSRFRGIRIFDISDIRKPRQVAAIQTCRGSHTHTIVNDPGSEGTLYIYGSGTAAVRPAQELAGCSDANPAADPDTARFSIDVIAVPLAAPEHARVVGRPRIFADSATGAVAGLWRGGDHGANTQRSSETNHCHDITAYPALGLAAGACAGNGILLDVSDPERPVRLDHVVDTRFAYWHSATFNNDGTKVVFTDEWGGGTQPRCRASDPGNWGANAIFDVVDRRLQFRSYFKLPAIQTEQENCVAHNGSLVPVPGRDIMVQAWYQGGISVFDFTDSARPVEIAFFDRGPLDARQLILGGHWSAYWHDGFIYGTEIARGLDVLRLLPSEHLTQHEIDAASLVSPERFNAQQQRPVAWPTVPVVARAYLDQLGRGGALAAARAQEVTAALDLADQVLARGTRGDTDAVLRLDTVAVRVADDATRAAGQDAARLHGLADTLKGIAASLR